MNAPIANGGKTTTTAGWADAHMKIVSACPNSRMPDRQEKTRTNAMHRKP